MGKFWIILRILGSLGEGLYSKSTSKYFTLFCLTFLCSMFLKCVEQQIHCTTNVIYIDDVDKAIILCLGSCDSGSIKYTFD